MRTSRWVLPLLFLLMGWLPAHRAAGVVQAQNPGDVAIQTPLPGEAIQGAVVISGNTSIEGFVSSELSFSYNHEISGTWFLIQQSQQPVENGILTTWDTTTLTDSIYDLRLVVFLKDGKQKQVTVTGLRVRNYTPIETSTPQPQPSQAVTLTSTPRPVPTKARLTSTPLPTNPAGIHAGDIQNGLMWGGVAAGAFFLVLGIYLGLQALIHARFG